MKIVLLGASGQLGSQLKIDLSLDNFETQFYDIQQIDFTDLNDQSLSPIVEFKPNFIINAAAYTQVDKAEEQQNLAMTINGHCKLTWAQLANRLDAHFIDISTDYVFSGNSHRPYVESDECHPLATYGHSKLLGEKLLRENCERFTIFRTSWLYSVDKPCFLTSIQRLGREREQLKVVYDQIGTPTATHRLSAAIVHYLQQNPKDNREIYHFSNEGTASWYDFAKSILDISKIEVELLPIESHEYPTAAKRPKFSLLSKKKFSQAFAYKIPHWYDDLVQVIGKI